MAARARGVNQMTLDRPRMDTIAAASKRAQRRTGIPSDLEDRLGKTPTLPGRHIGDARRLGMEYRGTQADEAHRDEKEAEAPREREYDESDEGKDRPEGQRLGLRPFGR